MSFLAALGIEVALAEIERAKGNSAAPAAVDARTAWFRKKVPFRREGDPPSRELGTQRKISLQNPVLYANVIHMAQQAHATSVLSVRVSPEERAILEAAAEQSRTTLSDFVRRKSLEAAETVVLNRIVTIPAEDWEAFEAWINRPAEEIPALVRLARRTPSWKR